MPVASRQTCEFPGCVSGPIPDGQDTNGPYMTHPECATHAEVTEDLNNHVNMVHNLPLKHQQVAVQQYQAETDRMRLTPQDSVGDDNINEDDSATASRHSKSKLETIPRPKIAANSTQSD